MQISTPPDRPTALESTKTLHASVSVLLFDVQVCVSVCVCVWGGVIHVYDGVFVSVLAWVVCLAAV